MCLTRFLMLLATLLAWTAPGLPAQPVNPNVAVDDLQFGNGKTKVVFDSAGRMYATEKQGRVLLFAPNGSGGFQAPSVLLDITANVDSGLEAGLLGFEVDPQHATNRFIYLFYTTPEQVQWDGSGDQRLVRYTMNATFDGIEPGSETVLLAGLPRIVNFHKAGDIGIHPLDPYAVFIALGDDDQLGGGATLPQDLDSYVGKILRVDSSTGLGLPDNPHWNGVADSVRSRVWARGTRNPFRFAFHPERADILYISENGNSNDRLAMVKAGGNGLWNGSDNGGFLTVDTPAFKVLDTTSPSLVGVEIVTSGPFAHNGLPTLYLANWLSGISRYTLSDSTDAQDNEWDTATGIAGGGANYWDPGATAMDLHLAADGHLYFTQTGGNASQDTWYPLRRYRYAGGTPPTSAFAITPAGVSGTVPYQVDFMDSSTAGSNPISSWQWDFGDGSTSTAQSPSHTYLAQGIYTVSLSVTDSVGLSSHLTQQVIVTLDTPVTLNLDVLDARSLPAVAANGVFTIALYQANGVTPLAFAGGGGSNTNELSTLSDGTLAATPTLPLVESGFVMVLEALDPPGFQAVTHGVALTPGQSRSVNQSIYVSSTTLSGRVTKQTGAPAMVDVVARNAGSPLAFAGAREVLPASLLPSPGTLHRVSTDGLGYFHIALPTAAVGLDVDLSFAEDLGRDTHATRGIQIATMADTRHDASIVLGQWDGGTAADDLSSQSYTPSVAYSVVEDIFSANCTGCHRAGTTNNGGLDLTAGNSYAELVNQPSLFVPGLKLVEPGSPSRSYLFEKINRANPQQGTRMRPSDALSLADQALIRDWITQLAPSYENFVWTTFGVAPGSPGTALAEDFDNDGISNGLEQSGARLTGPTVNPQLNRFESELGFHTTAVGLTLCVQYSDNLAAGQWVTVATRLRGRTNWLTAAGFAVSEASPGVFRLTDDTASGATRFYRFGVNQD